MIWAAPKGRSLGDLVPEMNAAFAKIKLPPGASFHLDGQVRQMQESNSAMGVAFLLALVFIYIVLASQFESFLHPVTIMMTTLPLAAVGAIVGVFLSGTTLAMGSFIGIIFLLGLVTKNAILVVDRAIVRVRDHGETPLQAILEAGPERLRPILMTSAAMVLGMLPTALGRRRGKRVPLADGDRRHRRRRQLDDPLARSSCPRSISPSRTSRRAFACGAGCRRIRCARPSRPPAE